MNIEEQIVYLEGQLTGELAVDCEIREQINELKSQLPEAEEVSVCEFDDGECLSCGA